MNILKLTSTFMAILCLIASTAASAEYRVSPFHDTLGYRDILSGDVTEAIKAAEKKQSVRRLNFWELNNLCVAQIMALELTDAVSTCESAAQDLESKKSVRNTQKRKAAAQIYSNLGVARALSGDLVQANAEFETAISFDGRNRDGRFNLDEVRAEMSTVAAGT